MEPVTIPCPSCGQPLRVRNPALLGKQVRCPKCQQVVLLEAPSGADDPFAAMAAEEQTQDLPSLRRRLASLPARSLPAGASRPRTQGSSLKVPLFLVAGLALVGAGVVAAVMLLGGSDGNGRPADAVSGAIDLSYLPDGAAVVGQVRIADLLGSGGFDGLTQNPMVAGALQQRFGYGLEIFDSFRFGVAPGVPPDQSRSVAVLRLTQPVARELLGRLNASGGTSAMQDVDDRHLIIASDQALLQEVVARGQRDATLSPRLAELHARTAATEQIVVLADLSSSGQRLTSDLPADPMVQRVTAALQDAVVSVRMHVDRSGMSLIASGSFRDESQAAQFETDLETLVDYGRERWQQTRQQLQQQLSGPGVPPEMTGMLDTVDTAFDAVQITTQGSDVTVQISFEGPMGNAAVLTALLLPAVQQAREAARRTADRNNLHMQGLALHTYHDDQRAFPRGTADAAGLQPEQRLSWMASILPHLDQGPLHGRLDFAEPWNSDSNAAAARTSIRYFLNPSQPETVTQQGYAATHYVGVAGVGPNAATLPLSDPNAGVFGYDRQMRFGYISDGTSNTMAVIGSTRAEPWAAGGPSTVRGLTAEPYVNGPDGFGSVSDGSGVHVLFADGSVRFVSSNVDPSVLRAMATARGEEPIDAFGQTEPGRTGR